MRTSNLKPVGAKKLLDPETYRENANRKKQRLLISCLEGHQK